jgi:hypothetical protein
MRLIPADRDDMRANVGDQLLVEGRTVETPRRTGEILEVHGDNGAPPYVVRWADGQEGLVYPGPDAHVVTPDTTT